MQKTPQPDEQTSLDPRTEKDLLIEILQSLQDNKGIDLNADQTRHYQVRFPNGSVDSVPVEFNQPGEYFWIPSAPRAMVVSFGYGPGNPVLTLAAGEPMLLRWPRVDALTFTPLSGGSQADSFELYVSTRPIEVPTKIAGVGGSGTPFVGYAEDSAHVTGDIGAQVLAVRNTGVGTQFASNDGDYSPIAVTSRGVVMVAPLWNGSTNNDNITNSLYMTATNAGASAIPMTGDTAFNGTGQDRRRTAYVFKPIPPTAVVAGVGAVIWTPAVGKKFRLMGWVLSTTVAGGLIFSDGAVATVIARTGLVPANTAQSSPPNIGNGILSAAANNTLILDVTVGGNVQGMVFGTEE